MLQDKDFLLREIKRLVDFLYQLSLDIRMEPITEDFELINKKLDQKFIFNITTFISFSDIQLKEKLQNLDVEVIAAFINLLISIYHNKCFRNKETKQNFKKNTMFLLNY